MEFNNTIITYNKLLTVKKRYSSNETTKNKLRNITENKKGGTANSKVSIVTI